MPEIFVRPTPRQLSSPARLFWWLVGCQRRRVAAGATYGTLWMIALAVFPYLLSRAIDDGLRPGDSSALTGWALALLGIGVLTAWLAISRHRTMTRIRMDASFRLARATVEQSTRLGARLARESDAGEIATIGMSDVRLIAQSLTVTGPGFGSVVAYVTVAVLLFSVSPLLAAVILAGVPILALAVGPLLGRLQRTGSGYREQEGALTARLVDVLTGLRVLNGFGGKQVYFERYRQGSRALREQGYQVGSVTSWVVALGMGLPVLFLTVVTWLAARLAAAGSITVGELVAVYGYAAMLVVPASSLIEAGADFTRMVVAARRVIRFLNLEPGEASGGDGPSGPATLRDLISGVEILPGRLTALAGDGHAEEIVDRLGGFTRSDVLWGGERLSGVAPARLRERVLVADNEATLFAGSVREVVAGRLAADDDKIHGVLHAAAAEDVVEGLPDGLDSALTPHGRNLSGGQRQRIRLARALYAEPDILLAVEPTSAVDSHTEALIASRLHAARAGLTTVVTTTSPLLLDHADLVVYLVDGRAAAVGSHHDLLSTEPGYRALVSRTAGEELHR